MEFKFSADAWQQFVAWQAQDKKTLKRINDLLRDISRGGYEGIGKPEPLKNEFYGWWSRRINDTDRLACRIENGVCEILQCKGH
jgi:toxin YoeB